MKAEIQNPFSLAVYIRDSNLMIVHLLDSLLWKASCDLNAIWARRSGNASAHNGGSPLVSAVIQYSSVNKHSGDESTHICIPDPN